MLEQNKKSHLLKISFISMAIIAFGLLLWKFDAAILIFIQNYIRNDFLDLVFPFYTELGEDGYIWIAVGILLLIPKKTRKCGIMVLAALLVMLVVNNLILKKVIARTRPCYTDEIKHFFPGLIEIPKITSYSFPSGHTTSAFSVAFTIYKQHKKLGIIALIMAAVMAFTRLYVFVHFPTDIYGGIIVAVGIAYFVYRMEKIITPRLQKLIKKKA